MLKSDRTTKFLLATIALLLAALVGVAGLQLGPTAEAQEEATSTTMNISRSYKVDKIGIIRLPDNRRVEEIVVLDNANAFVIHYKDSHLEVFSVVQMTEAAIRNKSAQRNGE